MRGHGRSGLHGPAADPVGVRTGRAAGSGSSGRLEAGGLGPGDPQVRGWLWGPLGGAPGAEPQAFAICRDRGSPGLSVMRTANSTPLSRQRRFLGPWAWGAVRGWGGARMCALVRVWGRMRWEGGGGGAAREDAGSRAEARGSPHPWGAQRLGSGAGSPGAEDAREAEKPLPFRLGLGGGGKEVPAAQVDVRCPLEAVRPGRRGSPLPSPGHRAQRPDPFSSGLPQVRISPAPCPAAAPRHARGLSATRRRHPGLPGPRGA